MVSGYRTLVSHQALERRPTELNARVRHQLAFTVGRSLPIAVQLLHKTVLQGCAYLRKGQVPTRQHVDAAKAILDRSGFRLREQGAEAKELSEMTAEELSSFVLAGEAELARRAKPVNAAETAPQKGDLSDIID